MYLISRRVSESRKEREESTRDGRMCFIFEDDLVELRGRCDLIERMLLAVPCVVRSSRTYLAVVAH